MSHLTETIDKLDQKVKKMEDAAEAIATYTRGLAQAIRDHKDDGPALEALAVRLDTKADAIAAVILEGTDATTTTTAEPTPPTASPESRRHSR